MRGIRLSSEDLAGHIGEAKERCLLILPGVDATIADALIERSKSEITKARVVIDGSHHAERSGYGKTSTWRRLVKVTELKTAPGTRLGLLVTEHGVWLFAPRAGKIDPREEEGLSAVELDANRDEARALAERIMGLTHRSSQNDEDGIEEYEAGEPAALAREEGEPKANTLTDEDIKTAEKTIEEHPPRDYEKEREVTVYTGYVGYIEIRLAGASLGKGARLKIPKELVERGLGEDELRARINESVRIDLDEEADTGVREINERLNAIRTLYTRQLGSPHGRIYRKRQKKELEGHFEDLRKEIERANSTLAVKLEATIGSQLDNLAKIYSEQLTPGSTQGLSRDEIRKLLGKAWSEAGAIRRHGVNLEVTFKDLTWETLRDSELGDRIVEQFPELRNSALYGEYQAYASN